MKTLIRQGATTPRRVDPFLARLPRHAGRGELVRKTKSAAAAGAAIFKIATRTDTPAQLARLISFFETTRATAPDSPRWGWDKLGLASRRQLAQLGSALIYGSLGEETSRRPAFPEPAPSHPKCVCIVDREAAPLMPEPVELPATVPVMPLTGVLLFPNALLPLHIFEPRFRDMLEHALHDDRMLCVALVRPERPQWRTSADFFPVSTVGLIRACVGRKRRNLRPDPARHPAGEIQRV